VEYKNIFLFLACLCVDDDVVCVCTVVQATDGFLFVVQCDTGRVIYVSDSITPVLNQTQVTPQLLSVVCGGGI